VIVNLKRFMVRSVFALYPGLFRKRIWAITNGITNDRQDEDEIEFVDKKTSRRRKDEASVIRAVIQEHRAVLGLANPADKISELKKDKERYYRIVLWYFVFLDQELERKAEVKLSVETNEAWERRKAVLMGKRFDVVPMCNNKSHFVTIDSTVLHGIMKEICPEFDASMEEFSGENRETYWKNIFDFKRLKVSKQKVFTGLIETDGVASCIHYRRLKKDRPVPPSAAPVTKDEENKEEDHVMQEVEDYDIVVDMTKHEKKEAAGPATQEVEDNGFIVGAAKHEDEKEADLTTQVVENNDFVVGATKQEGEKEAGPATQQVHEKRVVVGATKHEEKKEAYPATRNVQDNDFVVGADPGNTNVITIAAPKRGEDGTDGNLRQKDMGLLRFSRARYYREPGIMNARKKIDTWNSGMKDHLEALSEVTSRGAEFQAFRKFMEVRIAHWDALWEEYTKSRWARLRMNLYCGKRRAFANFFNELSALKEDQSQGVVVAYGEGR
jgi:hypothetical protein